ncbi:MAG: hypothetical protein ABIP94_00655 [Planctomycetota bacterium]
MIAKKTQSDKDWPMVRRLLEAHYFQHRAAASPAQVRFWLLELRTPALLIEVARGHAVIARDLAALRPLLVEAEAGREDGLGNALVEEERRERERDRQYWTPLKAELEKLRRERRKN